METEYQGVFNMGRVQSYMREGDGPNTLIYFDVYPAACRHCIRLYLTAGIGSEPKLFTAEELIGNGTNIGRRVADWKPTIITAVHPFCYDDKVEVLTNKGWKFLRIWIKPNYFYQLILKQEKENTFRRWRGLISIMKVIWCTGNQMFRSRQHAEPCSCR